MKKINVLMIALATLALSACSSLKDAAIVKVDVADFNINITADVGPTRSGEGITRTGNPFGGSYVLSINSSQFSNLRPYRNLMSGITIEDVAITITKSGGGSGTATNIILSATGVSPNFTLASYTLGQKIQGNAALLNFIKSTILQLKTNDNVTVSIAGETNVTSGSLDVVIEVKGIKVLVETI